MIKKYLKILQDNTGNLFASQDSKYFLATAFKVTSIPVLFYTVTAYAVWNLMEINFNFFVANGFDSGEEFKEAFYQSIFGTVSESMMYSGFVFGGVFLIGLLLAYLALRPFDHIEKHIEVLNDDPESELQVRGMNKDKLIYQVSRIFFKYIELYEKNGKAPKIRLPENLENLNKPRTDRVFLIQYALIVSIICMVSSGFLFKITMELYEQIVQRSITLLPSEPSVTIFISNEKELLTKITMYSIFGIIAGFVFISKNIIRSVDGVSYGFSRDMLRIVSGEHDVKLRPRYADPGKSMAVSINDYLEDVFPYADDVQEFNYKAAEALHAQQPPEDIGENDSEFALELVDEQYDEDDLPPAFIEEKNDGQGNKVFHITTPKGLKVQNLNEDMAIKVVMELEGKKKAS